MHSCIKLDKGDAAVARLLNAGVMKQWMEGDIAWCSYRSATVGCEDATEKTETMKKAHSTYHSLLWISKYRNEIAALTVLKAVLPMKWYLVCTHS